MIKILALAAVLGAAPAAAAVLNTAVRRSTGPVDASGDAESDPAARADYEQQARRQVDELKAQLDAAQKKAAELSAQVRQEADRRVADLQRRAVEAQKQVDDLERSGRQRWTIVRRHLDGTLESLRKEYESLRKDLDQKPAPSTP